MKSFYFIKSASLLLLLSGFFLTGYGNAFIVDTTQRQIDDQFVIPYQENGLCGYKYSLTGEILVKAKYNRVYPFFFGMGVVNLDKKMGIIDLFNHEVIPLAFDTIVFPDTTFLYSVYMKVKRDGKWGLYNLGKIVIPVEYQEIRAFPLFDMRDFFCLVKKKEYWQIFDLKKKEAYPVKFDSLVLDSARLKAEPSYIQAITFKNIPYYPYKRDGKWGLLRNDFVNIKQVLLPIYDSIPVLGFNYDSWPAGMFIKVIIGNKTGYVGENGQTIFPPVYDKIVRYKYKESDNSLFFVRIKGKWGLMYENDHYLIPPKFDSIRPFIPCPFKTESPDYYFVKNQKGWKIYNTDRDFNSRLDNAFSLTFDRIIDTLTCCNEDSPAKSCFYPIQKNGKWGLLEVISYYGTGFLFYEHFYPDYDSISVLYSDMKNTFFRVDSSKKVGVISREVTEKNKKTKTYLQYKWYATDFLEDINMGLFYAEENPEFYFRITNKGRHGVLAQSCLCSLIPMDSTIDNIYIEHSNGSLICWNLGGYGFKQIPVANKNTFEEYDSYTDSTLLFKNRILVRDKINDYYGIIDTTGHFIIPPVFDQITLWNDTALLVGKAFRYNDLPTGSDERNSIFYRLEKDGIMVLREKTEFQNSISSIRKYGIMDFNGKMICPLMFDLARFANRKGFRNQGGVLYRGRDDSKLDGEIYDSPWNDVKQFNGVVGLIHANDKWGMIDRAGKQLLATVFDRIDFFDDETDTIFWRSLVIAEKDQKKELYNYAGTKALPISFDNIEVVLGSNLAFVTSNGKQGIFTNKGVELIPVIYDRIEAPVDSITINEDSTFPVWMNGKHGVVDMNGRIIVPVQ